MVEELLKDYVKVNVERVRTFKISNVRYFDVLEYLFLGQTMYYSNRDVCMILYNLYTYYRMKRSRNLVWAR